MIGTFDSAEIVAIHHWGERNRLFLWIHFGVTDIVEISFDDRPPLGVGRYNTEMEANQVVQPLAEFLKVPVVKKKIEEPAA